MAYGTPTLGSARKQSVRCMLLLIAACVAVVGQHRTVAASTPRIYVLDSEVTAAGDSRVLDVDGPATLSCTHSKKVTWSFVNITGQVAAVAGKIFNYSPQDQLYTTTVDVAAVAGKIFNYSPQDQLYTTTVDLQESTSSAVGQYRCAAEDDLECWQDAGPRTDEHCMQRMSSVYIFLKGSSVGPLVLGERWGKHEMMDIEKGRPYNLPCKPSHPEATVTLKSSRHSAQMVSYNRPNLRTGFIIPGNVTVTRLDCKGSYEGRNATVSFLLNYYSGAPVAPPQMSVEGARQRNGIDGAAALQYDVLSGSNVTVVCGPSPAGYSPLVVGRLPPSVVFTMPPFLSDRRQLLHLFDLTESGEVDCYITNRHVDSSTVTATLTVIELHQRYLHLDPVLDADEGLNRLSWRLNYRAHATPCITWIKVGDPDEVLLEAEATDREYCSITRRHCITILPSEGKVMLSSAKHAVGAYIVTASLGDLNQTVAFNYSKKFAPQDTKISLESATTKVRQGAPVRVECSAAGFPSPDLTVLATPCQQCDLNSAFSLINSTVQDDCHSTKLSCQFAVEKSTVLYVSFLNSTSIFCFATNVLGNQSSEELKIGVYDTPTDVFESLVVELREDSSNYVGFGRQASSKVSGGSIQHYYHNTTVVEGSSITLQCRAQMRGGRSQMLLWQHNTDTGCHVTQNNPCTNLTTSPDTTTSTTVVSTVSAMTVPSVRQEEGACLCWACTNAATREMVALLLTVRKSIPPRFLNESWQQFGTLDVEEGHTLLLRCPVDGLPLPTVTWLKDDKNLADSPDDRVNITTDTLSLIHSKYADSGLYTCVAGSRAGAVRRTVQVTVLSGLAKASMMLLSVVTVVSVMLVIVSAMVFYRILQDRKKQRQLRLEEQELFEAPNSDLLDPGLSPQEQVDLLPYKPCYNIDRDCLIFERQLGVGAFGRVYQAQLITRVPGELPTTVAVKTIKSKTNNEHVRAFRSEIKIMMYVGRHCNIINLIGVCCKDMVDKGEMLMVVEYCKHKSLLDYMRSNRRLFEEQTSGGSDGVSISPGSPTMYFPAGTIYQNTGTIGTFSFPPSSPGPSSPLLLGPTLETLASLTGRSVSELAKARLLDWALQVANAMAFLAGKKIIHGDLATRNILLTEDNIIKVADFGLAKDVYNKTNNIYKLDTNRVLAIKWTALETLKFSELTTASDVWAFGVVMWEIFSLGANPYTEVENLMHFLESGSRLQKPRHCSDHLYGVMLQCWQEDPAGRPTFEVLEYTLRNFDLITENQGEINPSFQSSGWSSASCSFRLPYAGLDHSTTTTYLPMSSHMELPTVYFKDDTTSQSMPDRQNISSPKPDGESDGKRDSINEEAEVLVVKNEDANAEDKLLPSNGSQSQFDDQEANNNMKGPGGSFGQICLAAPPMNTGYVLHSQPGHHRGKSKSNVKEENLSCANDLRDGSGENYPSATSAAQIQNNPEYVLLSMTTMIK